jgi:ubiquitin-protein ligase E3 A
MKKRPAGPTVVAIYMFRPEELQLLLTGIVDSPSTRSSLYSVKTFEELRAGATYEDYTPSSTVIEWFWSIVLQTFTNEQRRKLLWFVTASDRIPLGGLKELTFCVQRNGGDADRLPTALTCFGRLLLPEYRSREKLMEMLSMAIEESEGFGLI